MSDTPIPPGIEAVARWLCNAAEYHEAHWRLYVPRARSLVDAYLKATQ